MVLQRQKNDFTHIDSLYTEKYAGNVKRLALKLTKPFNSLNAYTEDELHLIKKTRPYSPWQNGKVEISHREDRKILYNRSIKIFLKV